MHDRIIIWMTCTLILLLPVQVVSAGDGVGLPRLADSGSYWEGSLSAPDYDPYGGSYGGGGYGGGGYGDSGGAGSWRGGGSADDGHRSDWYSQDWYRDQAGGASGADGSGRDSWNAPRDPYAGRPTPDPGRDPRSRPTGPETRSDDIFYGAPAYQEPARAPRPADDFGYGGPADQRGQAGADGQGRGYDPRNEVPDGRWRGRSDDSGRRHAPAYRFRDDPRLEQRDFTVEGDRYRFRPPTEREQERWQDNPGASRSHRFVEPRPPEGSGRRYSPGEAFGYEPERAPGGFYDRYYRTDP